MTNFQRPNMHAFCFCCFAVSALLFVPGERRGSSGGVAAASVEKKRWVRVRLFVRGMVGGGLKHLRGGIAGRPEAWSRRCQGRCLRLVKDAVDPEPLYGEKTPTINDRTAYAGRLHSERAEFMTPGDFSGAAGSQSGGDQLHRTGLGEWAAWWEMGGGAFAQGTRCDGRCGGGKGAAVAVTSLAVSEFRSESTFALVAWNGVERRDSFWGTGRLFLCTPKGLDASDANPHIATGGRDRRRRAALSCYARSLGEFGFLRRGEALIRAVETTAVNVVDQVSDGVLHGEFVGESL